MGETTTRPGKGAERARDLARAIEHDIGMGSLGAGAWLKQVDLEERYGATRIEVRQALDRLAEKGLVKHLARRGYRVEDFDAERLRQIMEVRAVLEVAAAELVIARHDEATFAAMQEAAERCRKAMMDGTAEEHEIGNRDFHRAMLAPCPNRELVALLFDLRGRAPVAVTRRRNTVAVIQQATEHHFEMIRLIRARDLPALKALMRRHNLSPDAPGG